MGIEEIKAAFKGEFAKPENGLTPDQLSTINALVDEAAGIFVLPGDEKLRKEERFENQVYIYHSNIQNSVMAAIGRINMYPDWPDGESLNLPFEMEMNARLDGYSLSSPVPMEPDLAIRFQRYRDHVRGEATQLESKYNDAHIASTTSINFTDDPASGDPGTARAGNSRATFSCWYCKRGGACDGSGDGCQKKNKKQADNAPQNPADKTSDKPHKESWVKRVVPWAAAVVGTAGVAVAAVMHHRGGDDSHSRW